MNFLSKAVNGFFFIVLLSHSIAYARLEQDSMAFIKNRPYTQVVKDMVLVRCIAQVSEPGSAYSLDAARSANALREWVPFDIESGNKKVNTLIKQFNS